jgi:hypothetical protein
MAKKFGLLGFMLTAVACGTAPMDATGEDEAAINRSWEKVTGAYQGDAGIYGIVFESTPDVHGHHFFADVDNGIRCITTPCPSTSRLEGYYTVTSKSLWLHVTSGDSGAFDYAGKYAWKSTGKGIALTKDGSTQNFSSVDTYCQQAKDCINQSYIHILCVGYAVCNSENRCGYQCGYPKQ